MLTTKTVNDGFHDETQQGFGRSLKHGIFRAFGTRELTLTDQLNFFPLTTIRTDTSSSFWYQIVYSPASAKQTTLRCDVYLSKKVDHFQLEGKIKDKLESHIKHDIQEYEKTYARLTSSSHDPTSNDGRFISNCFRFCR
jgi:hypothetical protein